MIEKILMSPVARRSIWVPIMLLVAGCESDRLKPQPLTDPVDTYWDLSLDHHAVTLSTTTPYDTLTLSAIPHNYRGEPLSGLPAPQYTSSDPERVLVTEAGTLVAVSVSGATPVWLYATLVAGNLRHRDSVQVRVVDDPNPPVLAMFSIHPVPPDSAKSAAGEASASIDPHNDLNHLVRATDAEGIPLQDLLVDFRSSDTTVVTAYGGRLGGHRPGMATLYASTTAFGVTKADTLDYHIGWPLIGGPIPVMPIANGSSILGFGAPEITIAAGGYAVWQSQANTAVDVTFSDPTHVAPISTTTVGSSEPLCGIMSFLGGLDCTVGGSFTLPAVSSSVPFVIAFRSFPVPGTYEYHSVTFGTSGRIVVVRD